MNINRTTKPLRWRKGNIVGMAGFSVAAVVLVAVLFYSLPV